MQPQVCFDWLLCSIVGELGFLAEDRRINVAVTRARRHIAIVCDTQTVQNHPFLKSLICHMTEFGEVRTAFEYIEDIVPQNYTRDQKDVKAKSSGGGGSKQKSKDAPPGAKRGQKKPPGGGNSHSNTTDLKQEVEERKEKERRAEIKEQVQRFVKDSERSELQFPSSFNSHDRLLVHQVAEDLGLLHESRGEGKERCITVSRPQQDTEDEGAAAAAKEEQKENCELEATAPPPVDLKSLHLERMKREQQKREEKALQKQQHNTAPPPPTTPSSKKSKAAKGLFPRSHSQALCHANHLAVIIFLCNFLRKEKSEGGRQRDCGSGRPRRRPGRPAGRREEGRERVQLHQMQSVCAHAGPAVFVLQQTVLPQSPHTRG